MFPIPETWPGTQVKLAHRFSLAYHLRVRRRLLVSLSNVRDVVNSNRKLDVSLDGTLLSHTTNLNPMSSQSSKRDIISTSGCHFDFSLKSLSWDRGGGGGASLFRPHHFNFKVAHSEGLHRVNGKSWNGLKFEPLAAKIDIYIVEPRNTHTVILRKVVGKNWNATIPKGNMGYDQYTVPDISFSTHKRRPWTLMPFFQISLKNSELKTTHNTFRDCCKHFFLQRTFLEIAVCMFLGLTGYWCIHLWLYLP